MSLYKPRRRPARFRKRYPVRNEVLLARSLGKLAEGVSDYAGRVNRAFEERDEVIARLAKR